VLLAVVVLGAMIALPAPASASEILARNAKYVSIKVGDKNQAVVNYKVSGVWKHTLVWGAMNARAPSTTVKQVHFKIDYSGGWGAFGRPIWKTMKNRCRRYDGPALPWLVTACKAPDGSYWALQKWQRMLPNYGIKPWTSAQKVWELHISHWRGPLPLLEVHKDWVYSQKFHHLFGKFTYLGTGVYGFSSTSQGSPLDTYGRNLYVDTYNSAYGSGWKRENSFLMHRPEGNFCYGFYKHVRPARYPRGPERPMGHGEKYRWTIMGPGVLPVVGGGTTGLEDYDPLNPDHVDYEDAMNDLGDVIRGTDDQCGQH
jgi:hypothetical protein